VNVASTFWLIGNPNASSYAATKAALIGLTRQMVADYGPSGIRINAVAPGVIVTDMVKGRLETSEYFRKLMVETTPFPRLGKAEDVANVIAFLCSEEAGYVNGHVLTIDGGWSAANFVPQGT
jgi:NAD(P)-dependent dehydrogenase (short-subunit alcohol dehydrogenase family)